MRSLKELNIKDKRVLMRVDFNVPLESTKITDDTRIKAALPSINYILKNGGKLILMSHLGRPKGKRVDAFSLKPVAQRLSEILGKPVKFMDDCIGKNIEKVTEEMKGGGTSGTGDVMLLENLRFHPEEEKNDAGFASSLAKLGDVYVNDAFGTAHRAHASVEAITHHFDAKAPGFLMEKELKHLGLLLEKPERPFIALLGGAKISGKIEVIENLLPKVDKILVGGGMVFTFLKALGYNIGNSIVEEDKVELAKELLNKGTDKILLPDDIVIGNKFENTADKKEVDAKSIPDGWMGLDIGPKTGEKYAKILEGAKTVFWNGPTGVFEFDNFSCSTKAIAKILGQKTQQGMQTIIGGGDTVSAVHKFGVAEQMTHISTGGGASLEFLGGRKLPGVEALK